MKAKATTPKPIVVESGIPIANHSPSKTGLAEALRKAVVGDSFVLPKKARSNIHGAALLHGKKVVTRSIGPDEVRVWIVE